MSTHRRPPGRRQMVVWRILAATAVALTAAGTLAGTGWATAADPRPTVVTGTEYDAGQAAQASKDAQQDAAIGDLQGRVSALESAQATTTPPTTPPPTTDPAPSSSSPPATSSSPAPAPAADRGPSGNTVVLADDFENGFDCGGAWKYLSNQEYSGACAGHSAGTATRLTFPTGSGFDGGHAARFELHPGDLAANGERSEIDTGSGSGANIFHEGDEGWLQERIKVGPGIDPAQQNSTSANNFYILTQWHAGAGSPPLRLNIDKDGSLSIGSNGSGTVPIKTVLSPSEFVQGTWYDIDVHFRMSTDPSKGGAEVYVNGVKKVPWTAGATMADSDSYLKIGEYRNKRDFVGVVYFDDVRLTTP